MPSFGPPKILERMIKTIFEEFELVSHKIAGNGSRTTIVLGFGASVVDTSVSPIHQWTPQSCNCRKFPSQKRRDRERLQQYINLWTERIDNHKCSLARFSKIAPKIFSSVEMTAPSILRVISIQKLYKATNNNTKGEATRTKSQ